MKAAENSSTYSDVSLVGLKSSLLHDVKPQSPTWQETGRFESTSCYCADSNMKLYENRKRVKWKHELNSQRVPGTPIRQCSTQELSAVLQRTDLSGVVLDESLCPSMQVMSDNLWLLVSVPDYLGQNFVQAPPGLSLCWVKLLFL